MSGKTSADTARPGELDRFAIDVALYSAWGTEFWIPADPDYGFVDYFEAAVMRNLDLLHGLEDIAEDADRRGILPSPDCDQARLVTDGGTVEDGTARDTLLRKGGVQQRMRCKGQVAHNIEEAFVTVEKLLEAVESDEPLTDVDGIGPKTAEVIEDWYENREEREERASSSTVKRTSNSSLSISFHQPWADALGLEERDVDTGDDQNVE